MLLRIYILISTKKNYKNIALSLLLLRSSLFYHNFHFSRKLSNQGGRNTIIYFNLENPYYHPLPMAVWHFDHFRVNLTMTYKVYLHTCCCDSFNAAGLKNWLTKLVFWFKMNKQHLMFSSMTRTLWPPMASGLTTTPLYGEMVSLLKIKFTLIRRRKLQKDFSLGKTRDALMKVI